MTRRTAIPRSADRRGASDRVIGGFIHKVNATVSAGRLEGLHLFDSYAEVAALLHRMQVITATRPAP